MYGGASACGVHATCTDLAAGSNGRICTCESGYETLGGKTKETLYGVPADGQGRFGGGSATSGLGCPNVIDMCKKYGCGDITTTICVNGESPNTRNCSCALGLTDSTGKTMNVLNGNTTAPACSGTIHNY